MKVGRETNLHAHEHLDGPWYVRQGQVRLYTTDHEIHWEFGSQEGPLIPRAYLHWFESVGDEEARTSAGRDVMPADSRLKDFATDHLDYEANQTSCGDAYSGSLLTRV